MTMRFTTETAGVTFIAEDGDIEVLMEMKERDYIGENDRVFLVEMLEYFGFSTNGGFQPIQPADVGALTDSPMFADDVDYADDGSQKVIGNVYWFPNYQVENFADTLIRNGKVFFHRG
jgi:hypothetical protein